jgi:urease accessory protein
MEELAPGWRARLTMRLGPRGDRTRLRALSHEGPLRVQRLFHPEPDGTAHSYVLHPPGGVVSGDELAIDATLERHGSALVTTPGATKVYRSARGSAKIRTSLVVHSDAVLEHVPQETIVFDGADVSIATSIALAPRARFLGWELVCLGRPACGERFTYGAVRSSIEVLDEDRSPRLIERGTIDPALARARHGLGGHAALGTLVATDGELEAVREILEARGLLASATRVADLLVVRALAADVSHVRSAFEAVRHHVRARWGRAPIDPAIWRT